MIPKGSPFPADSLICRVPSIAEKIISFYASLEPPPLPRGIHALLPQASEEVQTIVKTFFHTYFNDNRKRRLAFGINPGRFGAGTTGINFTGPRQLLECCGIPHPFKATSELSAEFIYEFIALYGGPKKFYGDYFISAVCPVGFTRKGVNMNYYDDKRLADGLRPFIISKIRQQLAFGFHTDRCICIGGDKNLKFLSELNNEYGFFEEIIPLPHPRFIMQYRRRHKQSYLDQYLEAFRLVS